MTNKAISLIVVLLLTINTIFAQFNYPIVTTYKGDSVVFLTMKQVREINSLLDKQNKKIQTEYITVVTKVEKIDSLTKVIYTHKTVVDSIKVYDSIKVINIVKKVTDSLNSKMDTALNWINKMAVSNSFIYYDYCTNKIVAIDLDNSNYIGYFNPISGNLVFSKTKKSKYKLDNYMFLNPNRIYNRNKRPKIHTYPLTTPPIKK